MTLPEALFTLTIVGILGTLVLPRARHGLDTVKVRAAREAAFGVATRARAIAVAHGGADFVVDFAAESVSVVNAAGVIVTTASLDEYDVDVFAAGASARAVIRYDSRGIGRMASQTVRFQRGSAQAGLTFSSYGRVRRW